MTTGPFTPDEIAGLTMPMNPYGETSTAPAPTVPAPMPEDTVLNRLRASGSRIVANPVVGGMFHRVSPNLAPAIATGLDPGGALVPRRDIKSFQNESFGQLQPMDTPLANVEAAPTLTMPSIGQQYGAGGGSGGSSIASLLATYRGDRQKEVGLVGDEARMTREQGVNAADAIDARADAEIALAAREQKRVEEQAAIENDAQNYMTTFMKDNQRMANDIANAKADRGRLFKNMDTGDKILFGVGSALGGFLQGLNGERSNQYLDWIEKRVQDDVNDQMNAVENKKSALASRQNMFGQLLQQSGNRNVAQMQLMNLQLEAMKLETKAAADRAGVPSALKAADIASKQIEQKQAQLQSGISGEIYKQKQAELAAAAATRAAAEEKVWQRQVKMTELDLERQKVGIEAAKAGVGPGAANNPLAGVPKDLQSEASKELQAYATAQKGLTAINDLYAKYEALPFYEREKIATTKSSMASTLKGALGNVGLNSDKDYAFYIEPNLPAFGDSAATLAKKRENIAAIVNAKTATPILDRMAPNAKMPGSVKVGDSTAAQQNPWTRK